MSKRKRDINKGSFLDTYEDDLLKLTKLKAQTE